MAGQTYSRAQPAVPRTGATLTQRGEVPVGVGDQGRVGEVEVGHAASARPGSAGVGQTAYALRMSRQARAIRRPPPRRRASPDRRRRRGRARDRRHGAQHRPAAPGHARRAAAAARPRRRADRPAEPIVGYMHRGAEKLFEVRDYRQIIVLANRHDWLSAFSNELGVVLGVERMLGMEVPERAVWARTAARRAEPGAQPPDVPRLLPARARRDHPDLLRVPRARGAAGGDGGGLRRADALHVQPGRRPQGGPARPAGSAGSPRRSPAVRDRLPDLETLIVGNEILEARTRGVGRARAADRAGLRRLGPDRAGQRRRRRPAPRRRPTSRTPSCSPTAARPGRHPDAPATAWRASRCCSSRPTSSLDLAEACLDRLGSLPRGPVNVRLPKVLKVPEGDDLHGDREPARLQRLLPGLPRREDPVAAQAAVGVVQQRRRCCADAARAAWSPTWSRSSGRCSSSSATSTSSGVVADGVPGR